MKNYKDMADAVFARRDEYVASVKRKKKIALNASLSLCAICLAVLGAFGIWQSGVLEPDPNVIGTKPQSYTEGTDNSTLHSLSSNATSEGNRSEATEVISGNTKPQNTTDNNLNPTEGNKTQSTDPAERPTTPVVKPTVPTLRPTLPTLPVGPKPPAFTPDKPDVPPTSGDTPKPKPTIIATDPVETEPWHPDTGVPPIVIPPVTDGMDRPGNDSNTALPEEPLATEPCWTQPPCEEPTTCSPTTAVTIEPTDPTAGYPEAETPMDPAPPTEPVTTPAGQNVVKGKVFDQYGNPVKGAVVSVYSNGQLIDSFTTQSSGYYYLTGFGSYGQNYLVITSAPQGYSVTGAKFGFQGTYNYMDLICNKK